MSARFSPEAQLEGPTSGKGSGVGKGAASGILSSILGGLMAGGVGAVAGVLLAPAFGIGGAVYGAIAAESAATVEETEHTLRKTVAGLEIQESLRDRVFQVAREQTRHSFVLVEDRGPTVPGNGVSYSPLTVEGIHTVLEVSVEKFGLPGGGINPPLPLTMSARARLVKAANGTELYAATWVYQSGMRKFVEWANDNAQPLRDELERAYQALAEQIVDQLFLVFPIFTVEEKVRPASTYMDKDSQSKP